jgi:hypothetical protein
VSDHVHRGDVTSQDADTVAERARSRKHRRGKANSNKGTACRAIFNRLE